MVQNKFLKSVENRTKFLYAKIFETIENEMPEVTKNGKWSKVRNTILDISNNILRANREDSNDYEIRYKAFSVGREKNFDNVHFSPQVLNIFRNISFGNEPPFIRLTSTLKDAHVLDSICEELEVGKIYQKDDLFCYVIEGDECMQVLNVFDKVPYLPKIRSAFNEWSKNYQEWWLKNGNW